LINQIKEKENICDKLEAEIVVLRKYLEKSKTQIKFINGSETLDNILSNQRSPDDKTGLGYKESLKIVKGESSTNKSTSGKATSYANALKGNNSQSNNEKYEKKRQFELNHPYYEARKQHESEYYQVGRQRSIPTSKFFIPRHPNFFYGYCFSCGNFGHKVVSCILFRYNRNVRTRLNKSQKAMVQNSFSPLLNDIECHICNNFGHKASECRSKLLPIFKQDKK
jgi:hypothetical protein